eukprot:s400_g30.t1
MLTPARRKTWFLYRSVLLLPSTWCCIHRACYSVLVQAERCRNRGLRMGHPIKSFASFHPNRGSMQRSVACLQRATCQHVLKLFHSKVQCSGDKSGSKQNSFGMAMPEIAHMAHKFAFLLPRLSCTVEKLQASVVCCNQVEYAGARVWVELRGPPVTRPGVRFEPGRPASR